MNEYYSKTILYSYKSLKAVMSQLDDLIVKKAISSMNDFSPCEKIAEKILALTAQKVVLADIMEKTERAVAKLNDNEKLILDYKYFKKLPKESFAHLDFTSRSYFRKQVRVVSRFAAKMDILGIDDTYFEEKCLKIEFFRELYKRVLIREKNFDKLKSKTESLIIAERCA